MKGRQRKVQGKKLKRLKLNQDKVGTQGRENRRRKHEGKRRLHTSRSSSVSRWQITRNLRAEWRSSNQVQPLSFVAWWTEGVVFYLSKRGSVASLVKHNDWWTIDTHTKKKRTKEMESHSKNHKEGSASYNCTEPLFSPHPTQSVLFIHSFCASLTLSLLLPAECHLQSLTGNKQRAETTNDTKKSLLSGVYMTAGFKSLYSLFLKVFPNHKRNFLKLVVIKDFIVYRLYSVSPWEVTSQLSLKLNGLKSREVSAKKSRYEAVVMVMFQEFIQFTYTLAKKKLPVLFCLLPFKAADEGPFSSVASVSLYFYLQHRDAASSFARIFYKLKWLPVLRWLFSR